MTTSSAKSDRTFWVTGLGAVDHLVAQLEFTADAQEASGAFRAVCGERFLAASMTAEPGTPCLLCARHLRASTRPRVRPASGAGAPGDVSLPAVIRQWSGTEVRALREARRMSLRDFATHLGVSDRMVSKWEAGRARIHPRPVNQAALDTSLARADHDVQERFSLLLRTGPGAGLDDGARP